MNEKTIIQKRIHTAMTTGLIAFGIVGILFGISIIFDLVKLEKFYLILIILGIIIQLIVGIFLRAKGIFLLKFLQLDENGIIIAMKDSFASKSDVFKYVK